MPHPVFLARVLAAVAILASAATAQFDGARVYWPLPKNTNIVSVRPFLAKGNASWSTWNQVQPSLSIESELYALSYIRVQPVFGGTAYWQAILPLVTLDTASTLPLGAGDSFANGLGDPALGVTVNVFGKPAMKAKDFVRHDQDLSVDLGLLLTVPLGSYDENQLLNAGSNQWKARVGAPVVKAFGPWVPGQRTTLEVTPAVHWLADNDNALGNRVEQDVLFTVEGHLTRDLTRESWLSLDYSYLSGGDETRTSLATGALVGTTAGIDAQLLGFSAGFEVNDSMTLSLSHMQTLSGRSNVASLDGSVTMITLSWSWHSVLESVRQFRNE